MPNNLVYNKYGTYFVNLSLYIKSGFNPIIMKTLKVLAILLLATFSFQAVNAQTKHRHKRHHSIKRHHHRIKKHH